MLRAGRLADAIVRAEFRAADTAGDRTQIGADLGDGNLFRRGRVPQATSPASVAAWVAAYRPRLTFTALTYPIGWPVAALSTLPACSSLMARDGRPGCPCGRSTSSATFRPMRSYFWARRIDLVSVLLIFTSDALLSAWAASRKKRSASVALKSFSFVAPIVG